MPCESCQMNSPLNNTHNKLGRNMSLYIELYELKVTKYTCDSCTQCRRKQSLGHLGLCEIQSRPKFVQPQPYTHNQYYTPAFVLPQLLRRSIFFKRGIYINYYYFISYKYVIKLSRHRWNNTYCKGNINSN